jgi:hypothetical protein
MRRQQIIDQTVRQFEAASEISPEVAATYADNGRQAALDELLTQYAAYRAIIVAELEKRLDARTEYLACEDFAFFDVNCCSICHDQYAHYNMNVVELADGRVVWACCPFEHILLRYIERDTTPEVEKTLKVLEDIIGNRRDPLVDELEAGIRAANTDAEKLTCCVRYVHLVHGRRLGHASVESIVIRALGLPECGPAKSSEVAWLVPRPPGEHELGNGALNSSAAS